MGAGGEWEHVAQPAPPPGLFAGYHQSDLPARSTATRALAAAATRKSTFFMLMFLIL